MSEEALEWLDKNMLEAAEAPDEAFDWIYMLPEEDWPRLMELRAERDARWREALAYIVCAGPPAHAHELLRQSLKDPSPDVVHQAALSLIDLKDLFPTKVHISDSDTALLHAAVESGGDTLQDVKEFLLRAKQGG